MERLVKGNVRSTDSAAPSGSAPSSAQQSSVGVLPPIALIGYGEVGQILAVDLHAAGARDLVIWDRLFPLPSSVPSRAAPSVEARIAASMADAVTGAGLIISAVTAANCVPAAREASGSISPGAVYLDLNSVAPQTKCAAAAAVEAGGGRYVEAAVMSPIAPKRIGSPMLIGGLHAAAFEPLARKLGFTGARVFDSALGRASAAKMCRSVMIKGLEALLTESLLAARRYGVEQAVLESLRDLAPNEDWERTAAYMISRSLKHGRRRAEEMREAARAVADAGVEPLMSLACATRQDWAAARGPQRFPESLPELLDAVLAAGGAQIMETT
jgi:3-hydroxyisobutyrate dehydrogenase-like beta-hydroxyacid dehydrogenase